MGLFIVLVQDAEDPSQQIRFEVKADSANTALQVAAARSRELTRMEKFMEKPT